MVRIQRFIEARVDGLITGRVLYFVEGEMPPATDNCSWQVDPNFKIEDDATHAPLTLKHYSKALLDGFAIVEGTNSHNLGRVMLRKTIT